jgi:hypothetical protein
VRYDKECDAEQTDRVAKGNIHQITIEARPGGETGIAEQIGNKEKAVSLSPARSM